MPLLPPHLLRPCRPPWAVARPVSPTTRRTRLNLPTLTPASPLATGPVAWTHALPGLATLVDVPAVLSVGLIPLLSLVISYFQHRSSCQCTPLHEDGAGCSAGRVRPAGRRNRFRGPATAGSRGPSGSPFDVGRLSQPGRPAVGFGSPGPARTHHNVHGLPGDPSATGRTRAASTLACHHLRLYPSGPVRPSDPLHRSRAACAPDQTRLDIDRYSAPAQ